MLPHRTRGVSKTFNHYMPGKGTFWPNIGNINTSTANYEYSRSNGENLPLPIQMQLSEKPKNFCKFFIEFLESTLSFEHFEKGAS